MVPVLGGGGEKETEEATLRRAAKMLAKGRGAIPILSGYIDALGGGVRREKLVAEKEKKLEMG